MASNNSQFHATKIMFKEALSDVSFPLEYNEWLALDEDLKAAALFVNFYSSITIAWSKYLPAPITSDTAVSTVMQYILKNVEILNKDSNRYTNGYFYTLAYNAICGVTRTVNTQNIYNYEMSNYTASTEGGSDKELDLFDLVPYEDDPYEVAQAREALWSIIAGMGPKAEKVANHLITGDPLSKTRKDSREYANDRLADVSVTSKEYDEILNSIKEKIAPLGYIFGY